MASLCSYMEKAEESSWGLDLTQVEDRDVLSPYGDLQAHLGKFIAPSNSSGVTGLRS